MKSEKLLSDLTKIFGNRFLENILIKNNENHASLSKNEQNIIKLLKDLKYSSEKQEMFSESMLSVLAEYEVEVDARFLGRISAAGVSSRVVHHSGGAVKNQTLHDAAEHASESHMEQTNHENNLTVNRSAGVKAADDAVGVKAAIGLAGAVHNAANAVATQHYLEKLSPQELRQQDAMIKYASKTEGYTPDLQKMDSAIQGEMERRGMYDFDSSEHYVQNVKSSSDYLDSLKANGDLFDKALKGELKIPESHNQAADTGKPQEPDYSDIDKSGPGNEPIDYHTALDSGDIPDEFKSQPSQSTGDNDSKASDGASSGMKDASDLGKDLSDASDLTDAGDTALAGADATPGLGEAVAVGQGIGDVVEHEDPNIGKQLDNVGDDIKHSFVGKAAHDIADSKVGHAVGDAGDAIGKAFDDAAHSTVGHAIGDAVDDVKNSTVGKDVGQTLDDAGSAVSHTIGTAADGVDAIIDSGKAIGDGNWSEVGQDFKNMGSDAASTIKSAGDTIADGATTAYDGVKDIGSDIGSGVKDLWDKL